MVMLTPTQPVWIYDRTICSGLGDRLGALLTVATLAHMAAVDVEMEWCSGDLSRVHGNVRAHIPEWTGFNYSRVEFLDAFSVPPSIRLVDRFEDRSLPSISFVGNELPAEEGRDQVYTLASRTTHLSWPVHSDDFTRAYHVVGAQLASRQPRPMGPYVVLHVRAPGKNTYAPTSVRDPSLFCTRRVLRSVLGHGHQVVLISDDLAFAMAAIAPHSLTVADGTAFGDMALLLGATGIIQHSPTGYSSYSSVPAMAHGIPLLNTYTGQDHRYRLFDTLPVEFHTCAQRKRFVSRLNIRRPQVARGAYRNVIET